MTTSDNSGAPTPPADQTLDPPPATTTAAGTNTPSETTSASAADSAAASNAPLPSTAQPLPLACACLNITVAAVASDDLARRIGSGEGPADFEEDKEYPVYLPPQAERIRLINMATFDTDGDKAWRKCWACGVRVYSTASASVGDIAPADAWVDVVLNSRVLYGKRLDSANDKSPLPFSGLVLDLPSSSTFGRPPASSTPAPTLPKSLLPAVPDPFFLPPPFIPSHPALRDMCKQAVAALSDRHAEIDRDIAAYIAKRAEDMVKIEDQVRAEVEALWSRFVNGPGRDDALIDRRGSITTARRDSIQVKRDSSPAPARQRFERTDTDKPKKPQSPPAAAPPRVPTTDLDTPSGVTPSEPSIPGITTGAHNAHTAAAAARTIPAQASLLSASLSANTFHAPPPRTTRAVPAPVDEESIEALAKTASNDGATREVAMSFAFSAMEEHAAAAAAARGGKRREHREVKLAEEVEEEAEDEEKGIDSWIGMERAAAARRVEHVVEEELRDEGESKADAKADAKAEVNGEQPHRKGRVTFQEPEKRNGGEDGKGKGKEVDGQADGEDEDGALADHSTDDEVFDMDTEDKPGPGIPVRRSAPAMRTIMEDTLSQTFAADAPSHRAAWRRIEARGSMANVLQHRRLMEDEDDDSGSGAVSSMARSVPVSIVPPVHHRGRQHEMQIKTSLTDREGHLVPNLFHAMRDRPAPVPIVGSVLRHGNYPGGRRGSRSGEREREQVKSYAADPGAVFEALESAVSDSEGDESDSGANNGFVPPHVIAGRRESKAEVGWRSLAG